MVGWLVRNSIESAASTFIGQRRIQSLDRKIEFPWKRRAPGGGLSDVEKMKLLANRKTGDLKMESSLVFQACLSNVA